MRLRLDERWINLLCDLPESGLGYQRVDVGLRSGDVVNDILVFNGEVMEWPADSGRVRSEDIESISLSDGTGAE